MVATFLILLLFLSISFIEINTSATSLKPPNVLNALQERSFEENSIPLQIEQILTPPAVASDGNNLNVVPVDASENLLTVTSNDFQAISTNYSIGNDEKTNRKYEEEERSKSQPVKSNLFYSKMKLKLLKYSEKEMQKYSDEAVALSLPLVWDNCKETLFQYKYYDNLKEQNQQDMERLHEVPSENKIEGWKTNNEVVKKRTSRNNNNATDSAAWLQKYNSLLNAKTSERHQQKSDLNTNKNTSPDLSITTVQVVPITTEVLKDSVKTVNMSFDLPITEIYFKESYTEDWLDTKGSKKVKIKFNELPNRETYMVPLLKLEEGFYPFSFMSHFFAIIHPFDFSTGLVKDIIWGQFSFPYSFLHAIKVESAFLVSILIFASLALIIPSYLIIIGILSLISSNCNDDTETGALFPDQEDSDCNDRVLTVITVVLILLCCTSIGGMILSNEQAALTTMESRNALSCACRDISTWLTSAARELHYSLVAPVDLVLQAYKDDLKNVENLLGEPIQKTISSESGIDLVLESLSDVVSESEDISTKISSLRDISIHAGSLSNAASDRLKDLSRQLANFKKHCTGKDTPLCDTINTPPIEVKIKFDLILREQQLLELRSLGIGNLTRAIAVAKQEFRTLPSAISAQTKQVREHIQNDMETRRNSIYRSSRVLSDIVRTLTASLHSAARKMESVLVRFQIYDFWRWIVMLSMFMCIFSASYKFAVESSVIVFAFVMSILICGMLCGCGSAKGHAKRTLQVSTIWICLASFALWTLICMIFLIAGHAEIYICHGLWDAPQYKVLSNLLDKPSQLFDGGDGVFDVLFKDLENVTIDVSVRDVLRDCEKDQPAYSVFRLDNILDVNKETSYFEWEELQRHLDVLSSAPDVALLKTVSANLSKTLSQMLIVSDVQLANYRMEYNGPVVNKDLVSLADQLINVAAQVTDLTISGRLESLASRTQRLHITSIKVLEQLRAEIVFKLTELELQLMPFRRKLNISLSHIHTAQYYIDNQGDVIAQKKVSIYVKRLISYVAGWRTHVLSATATQAAKCRPLFEVYNAARSMACSKYVASLHGWWSCGLLLGLSWCALTPLCVKLWRVYSRRIRSSDAMHLANLSTGHQETPTTAMYDSNNWNTPGPPPPPRSDSW